MNIKRLTLTTFAALAASVVVAGTASATELNFDQDQNADRTGTVSYDAGGALNGDNISFSFLSVDGGDSTFDCTDNGDRCVLRFMTGDNTGQPSGSTGIYAFDGGGSFTLTGTLTDDDTGATAASGTLLSGMFVGTQTGVRVSDRSLEFTGHGTTDASADLLAYLGVEPDTEFDFINTVFSLNNTTFQDDGSLDGDVTQADLTAESGTAASVPEPREIALMAFGLVLLGIGLAARRRSV